MGMSGWMLSLAMRYELLRASAVILAHEAPELCNMIITLHGITMIFFLVMPYLFGGTGNLFQPLQVGSAEVAYPAINNGSLVILLLSFVAALATITGEFLAGLGWVLYPPLSTSILSLSAMSLLGLTGTLLVNGTSSTATSVNFIGILATTRASPGAAVTIFVVSIATVSFLLLASLPSLTAGLIMLMSDTVFNTVFFSAEFGGDVLFWQHLFWVFGHPEVYVLIVPAFAVVSLTITTALQTEIMGTAGMLGGIGTIAILGLVVWAHHMYATGMEADARAYFAAATFTIAVPTGIKILHWVGTLA
jgi:heme/copper-type cytochrome/quinol oxidase subunit 1